MNYMVIRGKDEGMEVIHDCMRGDVLSHSTIVNAYIELNRRSSEIQGTALGKCLRAWTCIDRSMPAGVVQSRHAFVGGTVSTWGRWRIPVNKTEAGNASEMPIKRSLFVGNMQIVQ